MRDGARFLMKQLSAIVLCCLVARFVCLGIEQYTPPPKGVAIDVDLAELAKKRSDWPTEVKLTKDVEFPIIINGKQAGSYPVPSGTALKRYFVIK